MYLFTWQFFWNVIFLNDNTYTILTDSGKLPPSTFYSFWLKFQSFWPNGSYEAMLELLWQSRDKMNKSQKRNCKLTNRYGYMCTWFTFDRRVSFCYKCMLDRSTGWFEWSSLQHLSFPKTSCIYVEVSNSLIPHGCLSIKKVNK